ncbi:MAG: 5-formyltetrahydrofolate cyclo-ligase [Pseudonocardiales bacterium]|jgi:5-formyltetrahydrofolate cyclo-ligase|nr:5-formyltetrahydrofolate cyclo-ligase [Pseudonocardiales bacterium]
MRRAEKEPLRRRLLAARSERSAPAVDAARAAVRAHVLDLAAAHGWRCVAAYVPLRTEPGSVELLAGLHRAGVRVLVPLIEDDRDLDWASWEPGIPIDAMHPASSADGLGRGAIEQADAVLVPALAVDPTTGVRLGRGGGSYDRALARASEGAEVIALLFDGELVPGLPADEWDRPVAAVVDPAGLTRVGPH